MVACWFALTFVERPALCHVHHVQENVKTVVCKKQCGEPCNLCQENCTWECDHYKCSKPCGELCDRPRCNQPCQKVLQCGGRRRQHVCRGLCNEPCICRVCAVNDGQRITEIFFGTENEEDTRFIKLPDCQHIFPVAELDR